MSAPSDAEIVAALRVLVAGLGLGAPSSSAVYSQHALPPGISRDAYLRLHRVRTSARVEGWSRRGKARLVTSEAWAAEIERDTRGAPKVENRFSTSAPANVDDDLDRRLGIKTKQGATG